MKKIIRKTGNSLGIIFNAEEQKIMKLEEGDVIYFEVKDIQPKDLKE